MTLEQFQEALAFLREATKQPTGLSMWNASVLIEVCEQAFNMGLRVAAQAARASGETLSGKALAEYIEALQYEKSQIVEVPLREHGFRKP